MIAAIWTALAELAINVTNAILEGRKERKALEDSTSGAIEEDRARIKAQTKQRIREAKIKYWADRRARDAAKKKTKEKIDDNPYD
jgi:hypothetical protein